jgi:Ca2+-transporting ATPase
MAARPPDATHPTGAARPWHALHPDEAVSAIASDADAGLSLDEARRRLARGGPNALPEAARRSAWSVIVGQLKSPLIYLLFVAAGVALALGHVSDASVVFAVVLLNAVIGALQEGRAERALAALHRLASHRARVVRGGQERVVEARDVVPGDVLVLEAGDAIAADARLLHGAALQIAEAALTGESVPVAKSLLPLAPGTGLADRRNMIYAGTHVTAGRARALVVATGPDTEIGHIAALAEAAEQPPTPLERRVARFGRSIMIAAAVMFVAVNAIGLLRGVALADIVMVGISQVVGMIPEGLPVAMTIALAVGVRRMARRQAIVRRLAAVETLGSTTVICTDKTGTLTRNEMTATAVWLPDGRELAVTGTGYDPDGRLLEAGGEVVPAHDAAVRALLEAGALCNDAHLEGPSESPPRWRPIGDPTEVALVTLAIKGGLVPAELRARWPRQAELPFDPEAKLMATQHAAARGDPPEGGGRAGARGVRVFLKGAPEVLLGMCRAVRRGGEDVALDDAARGAPRAAADHMAARALRVLAIGVVDDARIDGGAGFAALHGRVTLLGLVGQIDPPRPEVSAAVQRCRDAGIRPVMVTGDHRATGHAIARELGIARDGDAAIEGRELDAMSDAELADRIDGIAVFARVHPAQKLRIVDAYQRRGEVVAMTGDGVNDAPALVKADVGVAMGVSGSEVAKEAAKIVLRDDNFTSIVAAVEEGRIVYRNIKKVVLYLLSTSMAAVLILMTALILGYPPPLAAVQILWINLVTEGTVTVTLIMEPPEGDEMRRPPTSPREPLLPRSLLSRMAVMTPAIAGSTLGWFIYRFESGVPFAQVQTETFTVLAVCQWINVLNCRSEQRSALSLGVFRNPWLIGGLVVGNLLQIAVVFSPLLGRIFHTVPFSLREVLAIGAVASLVLWVEEARKLIARRRDPRRRRPERAGSARARRRAPRRPTAGRR